MPEAAATPPEDLRDLGFGTRVAGESRRRLLNKDGSFNVRRSGQSWLASLSPYHALLGVSWPRFYVLILLVYVAINALFALAYLACGPGALAGGSGDLSLGGRTLDAFFFSVQTLATIGYGRLTPEGLAANLLVAFEALCGLLGFAVATSLAFARFSRPRARLLFSERAVVTAHRGATAFMFRLANARDNQLLEVQAKLIFSHVQQVDGKPVRRFEPLPLERAQVMFLPLHWTVVHLIDEGSPLHGLGPQDLADGQAEFMVLVTAVDETFSQTVYARSSYRAEEVLFGARFADMFHASDPQQLSVDLRRLSQVVPIQPAD